MVGLLTVVGVGTGLIYFVGGSFYGALIFHNFMALFGIVSSLADAGQLGTYQQPLVPLLVTASRHCSHPRRNGTPARPSIHTRIFEAGAAPA